MNTQIHQQQKHWLHRWPLALLFILLCSSTLTAQIILDFPCDPTGNGTEVDIIGNGVVNNQSCASLADFGIIPSDVSGSYEVWFFQRYESFPATVTFTTSNGGSVVVSDFIDAGGGGRYWKATLPNDGSGQLCAAASGSVGTNAQGFAAYITHQPEGSLGGQTAIFAPAVYLYHSGNGSDCYSVTVPLQDGGTGTKDIDMTFTIADVEENDTRTVSFFFDACGVSAVHHDDIDPLLGSEFAIVDYTLANVPKSCTSIDIEVCSITSENGQSIYPTGVIVDGSDACQKVCENYDICTQIGESYTLTVPAGYSDLVWELDGVPFAVTGTSYVATQPGEYMVYGTDANGCEAKLCALTCLNEVACAQYDLALIKTAGAASVVPGGQVTYTITVANQGNVASNDFTITDQIPAGMSYIGSSNNGSFAGGTVTWTVANLAPGTQATRTITLQVDDVSLAPYRNWAEISSDSSSDYGVTDEDSTPDTNTGNDTAAGTGTAPNDLVNNHDDITLDNPANDEDDNDYADVAVDIEYDLALIKTVDQATIAPNGTVVYTITVANQGNVASGQFTVADRLGQGMVISSGTGPGYTAVNTRNASWTIPDLAAGTSLNLTLTATVSDPTLAPFRNWAEITSDSSASYGTTDDDSTPDTNIGNDNDSDFGIAPNDPVNDHDDISLDNPANDEDDNDYEDVALDIEYDLALIKTASPTSIAPGGNVTFTITIANQGNVASNDFVVTDQLPGGTSYVSSSNGGVPSAGIVTWTIANLAVGATTTRTVVVTIDDVTLTPFRNWAEISSDSSADYDTTDSDSTPDSNTGSDNGAGTGTAPNDLVNNHDDITLDNPANDEDDNDYADVTADVEYDLALIKTVDQATIAPDGQVVYTITVANQGNVDSGDFTVADRLGQGMAIVSGTGAGFTATNTRNATWTIPNLAAGATMDLTLTASVTNATLAPFRNWAEITSDSSVDYGLSDDDSMPDTNIGNDNDTDFGVPPNDAVNDHDDITLDNPANDEDDNDYEDVDLDIEYDLALIKTASSATVLPGGTVTYTITVANQGNVPSNDFAVRDYIPAGMSIVSQTGPSYVLGTSGNANWTVDNLAAGSQTSWELVLQVDDATEAPFLNLVEVTSDSSSDYNTTDDDSTPDDDPLGDAYDDHDDISLDNPPNDEDDHDGEEVTLELNCDIVIEFDPTEPNCNAGTDGAIDITISGGYPPYTVSWGDGPITQDRTGIAAGNYLVEVVDDLGCTAILQINLGQPEPLELIVSETCEQTFAPGCDAVLDYSVSGGTADYLVNLSQLDALYPPTGTMANG
ncbi:hypothetical protein N8482_02785, partial [Chitinophagales bacterium]|nr:hypothetical protein [Chitinophagales bacterium]